MSQKNVAFLLIAWKNNCYEGLTKSTKQTETRLWVGYERNHGNIYIININVLRSSTFFYTI